MQNLAPTTHRIGEPVEELKRQELDDAIGPRPRGLSRAARADLVGGLVPGQHVADTGDAAARVTSNREPLQREGRAGAIPQEDPEEDRVVHCSLIHVNAVELLQRA